MSGKRDSESGLSENQQLTLELVEEALNGENQHGDYDDPCFVEHLTDHVAYRTNKIDDTDEITMGEARRHINELVGVGELERVTNDMWKDDKVTKA